MVVVDHDNYVIHLVTKEGSVVRQENDDENDDVEAGFADGQGANTRFNGPRGLVHFVATVRQVMQTRMGWTRVSTTHPVSHWTQRRTCW